MSQSVRLAAVVPTAGAAVEVARHLDVDPRPGRHVRRGGLTAGHARPEPVDGRKHEPGWRARGAPASGLRRAFLCQREDIVLVILVVASFVNEVITGTQVVSVTEER
jgi:hypothetical protein